MKRVWKINSNNKVHKVELFHGYFSGKKLLKVDNEIIKVPKPKWSLSYGFAYIINLSGVDYVLEVRLEGLSCLYELKPLIVEPLKNISFELVNQSEYQKRGLLAFPIIFMVLIFLKVIPDWNEYHYIEQLTVSFGILSLLVFFIFIFLFIKNEKTIIDAEGVHHTSLFKKLKSYKWNTFRKVTMKPGEGNTVLVHLYLKRRLKYAFFIYPSYGKLENHIKASADNFESDVLKN